jgi:hypothetical protein
MTFSSITNGVVATQNINSETTFCFLCVSFFFSQHITFSGIIINGVVATQNKPTETIFCFLLNRWRWVVFTCMAPACWATPTALDIKRDAYANLSMTTHWPCDDVGMMNTMMPSYAAKELLPMIELPPVAQSVEAKRLAGCLPYPKLKEGSAEWERERELMAVRPQWHPDFIPEEIQQTKGGSWKLSVGGMLQKAWQSPVGQRVFIFLASGAVLWMLSVARSSGSRID